MKRKRILSQKEFLGKVLKQDAFAKKIFEKLVELGCDQDMLREWMFQISTTLTMLRGHGIGNRRYLAKWDFMVFLSEDEVKKLCDRLLWVAVAIQDLGKAEISKYMKLMSALDERDPWETKRVKFLQAQRFDELPGMLMLYEESLRRTYKHLAKYYKPKKYDLVAAMEAEWLDNVKDSTGKFHFEEIGVLLEASCHTFTGASSDVSSRFTGEAVRRRYGRFRRRHPRQGLKLPTRSEQSPTPSRTQPP